MSAGGYLLDEKGVSVLLLGSQAMVKGEKGTLHVYWSMLPSTSKVSQGERRNQSNEFLTPLLVPTLRRPDISVDF